jgi:AraC family transcriptional regulator, positive regulator of tynA and feaB
MPTTASDVAPSAAPHAVSSALSEAAASAAAPLAELPRLWATDAVAPAQRFDYWVGVICEAFLEMGSSSRDAAAYDGRLTSVQSGVLSFNQVLSSPSEAYRTQAAIARGKQAPFYLITQLHTPWHVRQGSHVAHLRAGDVALVDASQCYELHFPERVKNMSIALPTAWVGQWLNQVHTAVPRVIAHDQGWGRSLSALCVQMGHDPTLAGSYPEHLLSDQLGATLAASLEPCQQQHSTRAARSLMEQATKILAERLDQFGVTADQVAAQLGVSVRTLHRSFAADNASFANTLRRLRLERAAQLLAQPRLSRVTVAELSRRCGFADASHFVREFAQAFGQTPAVWRKQRSPR